MAFHNVPPNGFPDLPDVEELEAVQKDVTNLKATTAEQGAAITNLNTEKANKTDIATEFSDLTNYNAGDLVYYEGSLYEFQVDHTIGAWETSEVIQKDLSDIVTTLKSGLTNLDDEILVYHNRYNGGDLWAGDTLAFNNIAASSHIVYHFVAIDTTAAGTPESAYLLVKSTGVQAYGKVGTFTTAYDAEHETLTITLPSSSYWDYRFEVAARRNG